jgi:hypothetical protein
MADLASVEAIDQVSAISISDTASHVSDSFSSLLSMDGTLQQLHLTDGSPILSLSHQDWISGADVLSKVDGGFHVDLEDVAVADAASSAGDSTVRHLSVSDTAADIASQWDTVLSLYNGGSGKLTALSLTDDNPLMLTVDQQTAGAALISDLLPDVSIVTQG